MEVKCSEESPYESTPKINMEEKCYEKAHPYDPALKKCMKMTSATKGSSLFNFNLFKSSEKKSKKIVENESAPNPKPNQPKNDDITNIIINQDIIEGFWEENEVTKSLIDIITLNKFNKIKNKVMALNKGDDEMNIIYTILVIYYLNTKCAGRLNEFKLVLNKADKYLMSKGIIYSDIISGI